MWGIAHVSRNIKLLLTYAKPRYLLTMLLPNTKSPPGQCVGVVAAVIVVAVVAAAVVTVVTVIAVVVVASIKRKRTKRRERIIGCCGYFRVIGLG